MTSRVPAKRRSEDERLRLFRRVAETMLAEPGRTGPCGAEIELDQGTVVKVTETQPKREDLRSFLMEIRKLDQPGDDAYLPEVLEILAARATDPEWRSGLLSARRHYDAAQGPGPVRIEDAEGLISPRQAFELWAYGEHLHNDYAKELRLAAMSPAAQAMVKYVAVGYMDDLSRMTAYALAAVRDDPGLASIR